MFWGLKWVNSHKARRTVLSMWQAPYLLLLLLFCWAWSLTLPRGFFDFVHVTFAFNTPVSSSSIRLKSSSLLILQGYCEDYWKECLWKLLANWKSLYKRELLVLAQDVCVQDHPLCSWSHTGSLHLHGFQESHCCVPLHRAMACCDLTCFPCLSFCERTS